MSSTASERSSAALSEQSGEFHAAEVADAVAKLSAKLGRLQQQIRTLRQTQSKAGPPASSSPFESSSGQAPEDSRLEQNDKSNLIDDGAGNVKSGSGIADSRKARQIQNTRSANPRPRDGGPRGAVQQRNHQQSETAELLSSPGHPDRLDRSGAADGPSRTGQPTDVSPASAAPDQQPKKGQERTGRRKIKRISRGVQSEQRLVSAGAPHQPRAGKQRFLLKLFRSQDNASDRVVGDLKQAANPARTAHQKIHADLEPTLAASSPRTDRGVELEGPGRSGSGRKKSRLASAPTSARRREKIVRPSVTVQSDDDDEGLGSASSEKSASESDVPPDDDDNHGVTDRRGDGPIIKRTRTAAVDGESPKMTSKMTRRWPRRPADSNRRDRGGATSSRGIGADKLKSRSKRRKSVTMDSTPQYIEDDFDSKSSVESRTSDKAMEKLKSADRKSGKSLKFNKERIKKSQNKNKKRDEKQRKKETASSSESKGPIKTKTRVLWRSKGREKKKDDKSKVKSIGSKANSKSNKVGARRNSSASSISSKKNSSLNLDNKKAKKLNLRKPKTETVGVQVQNQSVLSSVRQKLKNMTQNNKTKSNSKKSVSSGSLKSKTSKNKKKPEMKKSATRLVSGQTKNKSKKDAKKKEDSSSTLKGKLDKFSNDRQYFALKKRLTYCAVELNQLVVKVSDLFHKKRMKK